jgi:large subunit ribosomal protein L13
MTQKTTVLNAQDVKPEWIHIDASGQVVGRLATRIAMILMGKHKPTYTPHVDTGDFVVVTNAEKVVFTGRKWADKKYYHHTTWVGGLVETPAARMRDRHPERILEYAVRRMLPKTRLGRKMFKKLKIYAGPDHPHAAQQPRALDAGAA